MVYIGDPHMIAKITTSNWPKAAKQYDGFRPLSGNALFVQTNQERWKIQRKRLAPAFAPQVVDALLPCLEKHLMNYFDHLDNAAKNGAMVDFSSLNVLLTLDFIGDVAYGTELHALAQGPECRILKLFEMVLPELMKCGMFPLRGKVPILRSTRDMYSAIAELKVMAKEAVQNARKDDGMEFEGKKNKIFEILAGYKNPRYQEPLLTELCRQKEPNGAYTFSAEELCDNYIAFLVAGGDPTAHCLSFCLYEVLRNSDILAQVQAEVDAAMPNNDTMPSLSQVKLPYLNMVLKETLRYHSTGFGTFRTCPTDTKLGEVVLPANTTLALWNPAGENPVFIGCPLDTDCEKCIETPVYGTTPTHSTRNDGDLAKNKSRGHTSHSPTVRGTALVRLASSCIF
jgi:cholesterol 24-hydroxylase